MRHSLSVLLPLVLMIAVPLGGPIDAAGAPPPAREMLVYIGTYTTGASTSKGIYVSRLNLDTGQLSAPELAAETVSPSFLAIHPKKPVLYAANEVGTFQDKPGGGVSAFAINRNGTLKALNQEGSAGNGPCYVAIDHTGTHVLVANYGNGTIASFPIDANGRLKPPSATVQHQGSSVDPNRQKGPHAHSFNADPTNRFALSSDLGLDKVLIYKLDAKAGTLTPNDPPSASLRGGSGPRHLAFSPNGKFVYLANEMTSNVTAFSWDATKGTLTELQTISILPDGFSGSNSAAEIAVHPSGKFVYASNRGHDSIAIFSVDPSSGMLTLVGHQSTEGKTPRNFGIDPTGSYLLAANQGSDSVVVFRIDKTTGKLTPTGSTAHISAPVCVVFYAHK